MKIEIGKTYRTRKGNIVTVLAPTSAIMEQLGLASTSDHKIIALHDGSINPFHETEDDLVSEIQQVGEAAAELYEEAKNNVLEKLKMLSMFAIFSKQAGLGETVASKIRSFMDQVEALAPGATLNFAEFIQDLTNSPDFPEDLKQRLLKKFVDKPRQVDPQDGDEFVHLDDADIPAHLKAELKQKFGDMDVRVHKLGPTPLGAPKEAKEDNMIHVLKAGALKKWLEAHGKTFATATAEDIEVFLKEQSDTSSIQTVEYLSINDMSFPAPLTKAPAVGDKVWCVTLNALEKTYSFDWGGDEGDLTMLGRRLVHTTKEAAVAHADALLSVRTDNAFYSA